MALWTFAEISTLLWLDASDASTLYNDTTGGSLVAADGSIARWEDKSGNDRHATQGTSGFRPLRKTAIQDGLDVVRFDGTDDRISISAFSATAGISCFAVFVNRRTTGTRDGGIVFASSQSLNNDHFGGTAGVANWFSSFFSTSRPSLSASQYVSGVAYLTEEQQTGTAISGRVNATATLTSAATFNGSPDTILIGVSKQLGFFTQKDYCEIAFVQSPSVANRQRIEGYLAWKWGIESSLPVDHPFKSAAPVKSGNAAAVHFFTFGI